MGSWKLQHHFILPVVILFITVEDVAVDAIC
jgi:hypothetical protein